MTNYNTIPTSSHDASPSPVVDVESLSSDNQHTKAALTTPRRPWRVMFDFHSMGLPARSLSDASSRFKTNYGYFRMNYVILLFAVVLIVIFCSLIKHPISRTAFTVLIFICVFLSYPRDQPTIELLRYQINDRMIRIFRTGLTLLTVAFLVLTNAAHNLGWPLLIVCVLMLTHTVVRKTEDLFLDEEEAATTETYWNRDSRSLFYLCLC
ncbi:hypothetical protein Bca4012_068845 [Brassica carinata]